MRGNSGNARKKTFLLPGGVPFFAVFPKPLLEGYLVFFVLAAVLFLALADSSPKNWCSRLPLNNERYIPQTTVVEGKSTLQFTFILFLSLFSLGSF